MHSSPIPHLNTSDPSVGLRAWQDGVSGSEAWMMEWGNAKEVGLGMDGLGPED